MYCVLILFCHQQLLGTAVSEFTPIVHPAVISSQCDQYDIEQDGPLLEALQQVRHRIQVHSSCKSAYDTNPSAPSGYYQVRATNGSDLQVYCDMEGVNCGGEGGWTRVVFVDMTEPGAACPQGLNQTMFNGAPYCGRFASTGPGCVSAVVDNIISYQQVCGRVLGYQQNSPDAFRLFANISQVYFDGLAIMRGDPRKHVWTYTAGSIEGISSSDGCPCNSGSIFSVPSFVGNDYYCESGYSLYKCNSSVFTNDLLWDGQQCGGLEPPCCTHPNMPWFIKTLNETTTEGIELRACQSNEGCLGSVPVFLIEIYVR